MDAAPRIAVVDDEEGIRETVGYALRREGYRVETYTDGLDAWEAFVGSGPGGTAARRRDEAQTAGLPDLIVLDILMPRMDGLELCRRVRALSPEVPLVFLTSKDEEFDRVLGLELGGDDYLCKPFSTRELVARVKVLFRRQALARRAAATPPERVVETGSLRLDLDRYQASWKGTELRLTVTEFLVVGCLARRPGHVKTRGQLIDEAYPNDAYVGERTVDSHIKRLRRKLERADPEFSSIETVYGLGYRWRPEG